MEKKEQNLNFFLICSIVLYAIIELTTKSGLIIFLSLFILLYLFLIKKSFRFAPYLFVLIFLTSLLFLLFDYETMLPILLLLSVLLIIMSNALIDACLSFCIILILGVSFIFLLETVDIQDILLYTLMLFAINIVLWFLNYQKSKALEKEQKLLNERIAEMSYLVEFGRLSSGLFHDLINPLTALSLSLETINKARTGEFEELRKDLCDSFFIAKKLKRFLGAIKKQIHGICNNRYFSINAEIKDVLEILNYQIRKKNIEISFNANEEIKIFGDPFKFNHIILNLVSNAIDAYDLDEVFKKVEIRLERQKEKIILTIEDNAGGVSNEIQERIFEAFFTTKEKGTGIGLSFVKNIIENDFKGRICLRNNKKQGAVFVIQLKT